jgi:predicted nuclease of predicted toxin-antitoxin system
MKILIDINLVPRLADLPRALGTASFTSATRRHGQRD